MNCRCPDCRKANKLPDEPKLPSIVDGVYLRTSPSQISNHQLCPLKWWFDKVRKLPRKPPNKGMKLGTEAHGQIEHFLYTGEDVRGNAAAAGHKLLEPYLARAPFNGGDLLIEASIAGTMRTPGGVDFIGYVDLAVPPTADAFAEVIDHKFRKDLVKYGATADELHSDPQSVIYSAWAAETFGLTGRTPITFAHHQHEHTGGRARLERVASRVPIELSAAEARERFDELAEYVDREIAPLAKVDEVLDVPFDTGACGAFGGCDYAATCPRSPANRFASALLAEVKQYPTPTNPQDPSMSLLDLVGAGAPTAPAKAPEAPVTPPATTATPAKLTASKGKPGTVYRLADGKVGTFQAAAGDLAFFTSPEGAAFSTSADDAIEPVESAPAAPAAKAAPPGTVFARDGEAGKSYTLSGGEVGVFTAVAGAQVVFMIGAEPVMVDGDAPVVPYTAPVKASVLPPDAPPSTPGAKATDTEGDDEGEPDLDAPKAPAEKPKRTRKAKKADEAPEAGGDLEVLIIGGVGLAQDGAASRDLAPYIAALAAKCAAAAKAPDVRFAETLGYGKWKAALHAAALAEPPSGVCHVYPGDLADPVIEALIPLAGLVVRV